jgi:hypothetical protein
MEPNTQKQTYYSYDHNLNENENLYKYSLWMRKNGYRTPINLICEICETDNYRHYTTKQAICACCGCMVYRNY